MRSIICSTAAIAASRSYATTRTRACSVIAYDTTGNKTDVTFPDTRSQHWRDYDPFGQAWTFIDERNNPTKLTYQWGPMKKLHTVTTHRDGVTADLLTRFEYDEMGRARTTVFPDGSEERSSYEFGQLKTSTTRKGQVKTIYYDARGREISHEWIGNVAPKVSRSWDDANRLLTVCNIYSTIDYGYDGGGLMLWEGNSIAGSGRWQQTTFHRYGDGSVSAIQYPNGMWVYRDYTARGQLKTVEDSVSGPVIDYTYLPDGKVDHADYGNGTTTTFGYDGRGMISSVSHKKSANGPILASRDYTRDNRDRITSLTKENGRGDRFRYDEEGQLQEAWYNAANPASSGTGNTRYDGFIYDALGNRIGTGYVANRGQMEFTRKDNGLNQYRAWWPYSSTNYDDDIAGWGSPGAANGVLMQDGWITAGFNALNQPMYIWSANAGWTYFGYDPLGRCVKRWVGDSGDVYSNPATYLHYDGWNLLQEGNNAWGPSRVYVHGNRVDEIVWSHNTFTGEQAFHHYDARGHGSLLTDRDGQILERYEYDAFGQPYFFDAAGAPTTVNGGPGSLFGNRFLFTGREWLSDLKLYDYRHRMYQPELGRFLQPDPIQFAAGDYNLYRYCHNDPVNKIDPMGLAPMSVDEEADAFAQQANQGNLAAYGNNTIPFTRIIWPMEFGTAVKRDSSGNTSLNGPVKGDYDRVPFAKFVGPTTIIVTHNHTNQDNRDTKSFLSVGDVLASNRTGKPIYVITPNGQQDRFRPSDKSTLKERLNDPGVIERLRNGKWVPVPGSKPDIRDNRRVDSKLWR